MRRIYLDANATTPLHPAVRDGLIEVLDQHGNPGSLHTEGRAMRARVDRARERVADRFGVRPDEIFFTSGGTEANYLMIRGAEPLTRPVRVSAVEHPAVLGPARQRARELDVVDPILPVDRTGAVDPDTVSIDPEDWLSIQWVNHETGRVQDIASLSTLVHRSGGHLHSDGAQGFFRRRETMPELGLDAATLTAHKSFGPLGVAALYLRSGLTLDAPLVAGPQERGVRPGTENVAAIHALGVLSEISKSEDLWPHDDLAAKNDAFRSELETCSGLSFTVPPESSLPSVVHVTIEDVDSDRMLALLDRSGISASSGSACSAGTGRPSNVLKAMGVSDRAIRGALRFSFTRDTAVEDLALTARTLREVIERLRAQR